MKKLLLLITISVSIFSCQKKDIEVPDAQLESLFTTWDLVEYYGGDAGVHKTKETMGYTAAIEFNKNGQVKKFKNGQLESKDKFTFSEKYDRNLINFKKEFSYFVEIRNDSLFLNADGADFFNYIYVKR